MRSTVRGRVSTTSPNSKAKLRKIPESSAGQSVDTIESLDPDLHAGILEDVRRTNDHN